MQLCMSENCRHAPANSHYSTVKYTYNVEVYQHKVYRLDRRDYPVGYGSDFILKRFFL